MRMYEKALNYLKKKTSLEFVEAYFEDNIGMGEMYMSIEEIRGDWYVVDTDNMTIQPIDEAYEDMLEEIENGNEEFIEWLEDYYLEHKEEINKCY